MSKDALSVQVLEVQPKEQPGLSRPQMWSVFLLSTVCYSLHSILTEASKRPDGPSLARAR